MRLLHTQYFRHFDKTVRILSNRGHDIKIVMGGEGHKPNLTDRIVRAAQEEVELCEFNEPLLRQDRWVSLLGLLRLLTNYATYFRPGHPSQELAARLQKYFSPQQWKILEKPWIKRLLTSSIAQWILRFVEGLVPPERSIVQWIESIKPDVVVSSPYIMRAYEVEYLKAAKALKIPTVFALASWDNLTTKGTAHVRPDLSLVWNQPLCDEAVKIHNLPPQDIVITGAPTFDYWFEMKPSLSRIEFCRNAGMDSDQPFIVYLCSSRGMIEGETRFIQDLACQLEKNPGTHDAILLVRPHPWNVLEWDDLRVGNVRVWPEQGNLPDIPEVKQNYFDTLYYCAAAIGINTSAMLEAAIADKPCLTIIDERYRRSQTGMGHFRHLLNGDFLEVAYSYEEAAQNLTAILQGRDLKSESRRRFVHEFIRPHGVNRPVSEIVARVIELAAQRKGAAQIMDVINTL